MDKSAQAAKPRPIPKDPIKRKIEEDKTLLALNKKQWNAGISAFNKELKKLKNELHGNIPGADRVHLDEHLPKDLPTKLNQLSEHFANQISAALQLISRQSDIAGRSNAYFSALEAKRNKRKQQDGIKAASSDIEPRLISEAISPNVLRWQKIKNLFGTEEEKIRVKALDRVFNLDRLFSEAEAAVLNISDLEGFKQIDSLINRILTETPVVKQQILFSSPMPAVVTEPVATNEAVVKPQLPSEKENTDIFEKIKEEMAWYDKVMIADIIASRFSSKNKIDIDKLDNMRRLRVDIEKRIRKIDEKKEDVINVISIDPLYRILTDAFVKLGLNIHSGSAESVDKYNFFKKTYNNIYRVSADESIMPSDQNKSDDLKPWDPIVTNISKSLRRKFLLGFDLAEDKKIFFDLLRANRLILEELMQSLRETLNPTEISNKFEKIVKNNFLLQQKLNLMIRPFASGLTGEQLQQMQDRARRSALLSGMRGLFSGKKGNPKAENAANKK